MDILHELQQLLGERVRVEKTEPKSVQLRQLSGGEEDSFQLDDGRYLIVDTASFTPETLELLRFLLQKLNLAGDDSKRGWFARLVNGDWADAAAFVQMLSENGWNIQLPALLAVIESKGEGRDELPELLKETLSEYTSVLMTEDEHGRLWLYLPISEGTLADWKESAVSWADTLLTELYLDVRIGISRQAEAEQDLLRSRKEAEIALQAGAAFQKRQAVHYFGELGLAHVLHGVSREAKADFLQEVLPAASETAVTQDLRDTVLAFAQHGQNIAETARSLFIHRNTLLYRLEKIEEETGRDIRKFEDLLVLWLALMFTDEQSAQ